MTTMTLDEVDIDNCELVRDAVDKNRNHDEMSESAGSGHGAEV